MIWCRGARSRNIRGVTPLSTWVQGSSGDMAVQRAETPSVCGERSSAHEKQSPPSPVSLDLSSSALALQLARNEWARITVFGTSRVQSGLRLDRQLETSSARCQTPWEGGGASERNVLFPPPPAAGFRETVGVAWARSRRSGERFLCPARRPVRGSSASGEAGRMAMVTRLPKGPQSRVLPFLADLLLIAQLQCHSARDRRLPVRSLDWCRRP